jgi:hypothetical protein
VSIDPISGWRGSNSAMPMFEGFRFMRRAWALADSKASNRNRRHTRVYLGSPPRRVKTYIQLV